MTAACSMRAISRSRPPHRGQASTSNPNVRRINSAQRYPRAPSVASPVAPSALPGSAADLASSASETDTPPFTTSARQQETLREHRAQTPGATQFRAHDGQVQQGEPEVRHACASVGQTSGAAQRCRKPGFSRRIANSRRTGAIAHASAAAALHGENSCTYSRMSVMIAWTSARCGRPAGDTEQLR